jgi:DNA recombination protein RmuC
MIKVGNQLDNAKNTYSKAMKKLYEGRKNMLSKAEELKIMGVPTSKSIDKRLLDRISEEDTDENNSKTDISPFNPPL